MVVTPTVSNRWIRSLPGRPPSGDGRRVGGAPLGVEAVELGERLVGVCGVACISRRPSRLYLT